MIHLISPSNVFDQTYSDSDTEGQYIDAFALYMATQTDPRMFKSRTSSLEEPHLEEPSDQSIEEIFMLEALPTKPQFILPLVHGLYLMTCLPRDGEKKSMKWEHGLMFS